MQSRAANLRLRLEIAERDLDRDGDDRERLESRFALAERDGGLGLLPDHLVMKHRSGRRTGAVDKQTYPVTLAMNPWWVRYPLLENRVGFCQAAWIKQTCSSARSFARAILTLIDVLALGGTRSRW